MKKFLVRSKIGSLGEKLAERYVLKQGHTLLATNYYFEKGRRSGEIDIITAFEGSLHFIEVKTRHIAHAALKNDATYFPIEAQVSPEKIRKCVRTAEHYLRTEKKEDWGYHFDLITVLYNSGDKRAEIQYFRDIFY